MDKYIPWYNSVEEIFGKIIPKLSENEIINFVSREDWMIIPLAGETNKKQAKKADRPNLTINLSEEGFINFGIIYEKLENVKELRNILLPYNEKELKGLLKRLRNLSNIFVTGVDRKTKEHHHSETPKYDSVFQKPSNEMDFNMFNEAFNAVDEILDERERLESNRKFELAPTVNLVYGTTRANKEEFKRALSEIKPIYSMILKMKTEEEIEVCDGCLCFTCEDKGKYEECNCPCPSFPKQIRKVTWCIHKSDPY